jgi:hypothetical protein
MTVQAVQMDIDPTFSPYLAHRGRVKRRVWARQHDWPQAGEGSPSRWSIQTKLSSETLSHLLSLFGLLWNGENSRLSSSEWLTPGRWGSVVQICCRGKDHRLYRIRLIVWRGYVGSCLSKNSSVSAGCIPRSTSCANKWEKVNNPENYGEKQTM